MRPILALCITLCCALLPAAETPYKVTATIAMIADVIKNVAGEHAEVTTLVGEGVDPHLYRPSRADVVALSKADLIFYNGIMLEGKMSDVLVKVARSGKPVYAVTETILENGDYVMTDENEYFDPHVWNDVSGWMLAADVIRDALTAFDPDNAADYAANTSAYQEKAEGLGRLCKKHPGHYSSRTARADYRARCFWLYGPRIRH